MTDEHLDIDVWIVTGTGRHSSEPIHVAVMVSTQKIDADVKSASPLVYVVRGIRGEVGELTISLDEYTILIVVKVTGAQPGCTIEFEDMPLSTQFVEAALHSS